MMLTKVPPKVLTKMPLFRDLSSRDLARVSELLHPRWYPARTQVVSAGQPADSVSIVLEGAVKVFVETMDRGQVILAILTPGEVVGEMSLVDNVGRSATVVAHEDSVLLSMDGAAFSECLRTIPALSLNLAGILSHRLRVANARIQTLSTLDVHGRVARQFLSFAEACGRPDASGGVVIPFRLSQSDLAGLIGSSRVRVNQVLVDWKARGYVSVDTELRVTIRNRGALARICGA